jgi:hypothetical protein
MSRLATRLQGDRLDRCDEKPEQADQGLRHAMKRPSFLRLMKLSAILMIAACAWCGIAGATASDGKHQGAYEALVFSDGVTSVYAYECMTEVKAEIKGREIYDGIYELEVNPESLGQFRCFIGKKELIKECKVKGTR